MFQALKNWRAYKRFSSLPRERKKIVFYSESGQDWHHFAPVINYLTREMGEEVIYLTSDPDDMSLSQDNTGVTGYCIGGGLTRTICFQWLDAITLTMTMLDFNKLQIKRSVNPVCYIYMFHTLVSTHRADHADSYDDYDAILCAGPHHTREIRGREKMLGLKRKQLFEHGYHRLEELLANRREPPQWSSDEQIHVLLAPSWGEQTILNVCGMELVDVLLAAGFKVTLRPHYQTRWTAPEMIDRINDKYQGHPQFTLMEQMGESDSLYDSHLMITDWSGAGIEYGLGLEKPVLYIDVPPKARNDWWPELDMEPFESFIREEIGAVVAPDSLQVVPDRVLELLKEPDAFRENIRAVREAWVYNLGDSARVSAEAIVRLAGAASNSSDDSPAESGEALR